LCRLVLRRATRARVADSGGRLVRGAQSANTGRTYHQLVSAAHCGARRRIGSRPHYPELGGWLEPSLPSLPGGPGSPWAPREPGSPLPVSPLSPLSPFGPEHPARASATMISMEPASMFFVMWVSPQRSRGINIVGDQLVPNALDGHGPTFTLRYPSRLGRRRNGESPP
jgi:hypothetical protein